MAGPAHNIGEDERQKRFKKPAADAIQHLDGQEPGRIVKPYAKPAAQRKRSEDGLSKRPSSWPRDSGDRKRQAGRGMRDGARRHRPRGLGADRAETFQNLWRDAASF